MSSYAMVADRGLQTGREECFLGGKPKLPLTLGVPTCTLCDQPQTFFLQLAFPGSHPWSGHSLALFACTSCADERYLIPEMLVDQLSGASVSSEFLAAYQKNFRILVFRTELSRLATYIERVQFRPLRLVPNHDSSLGWVGGKPEWVLADETPGNVASSDSVVFLLQISANVEFETVDGAPAQIELSLEGSPIASPVDTYQLFLGNAIYLFGSEQPVPDRVYVITQTD